MLPEEREMGRYGRHGLQVCGNTKLKNSDAVHI